MIPSELAKKIRYIRIYTNRIVNDILAGEYQSSFKGQGIEFEEVREYQPGDEVRSIDWNVTARMGKPYVKRFIEERELTVIFIVDLSTSGSFGTFGNLKNEVAAELSALLAFSAIKNNDKVGLVIFTDKIEKFIPPTKGTSHVLRVIRELLYFKPQNSYTDINCALDYLGRITTKKCVVFLVSDFLGDNFEKKLKTTSKRHDLIAISITDPRELEMPDIGLVELEDAETGELITIDTGYLPTRADYGKTGQERLASLREIFSRSNTDYIDVRTSRDYARDIVKFFTKRRRRGK